MITIQLADEAQAPQISTLLSALFSESGHFVSQETLEALFPLLEAYEAHSTLIATDKDGDVVGVLTLTESVALYAGGKIGVLNELYVVPEYRSEGVGKMLLDAAKDVAEANGWQRLEVTTPGEEYVRTRRFYEREGFVEIGPRYKIEFG